MRYYLSIFLLSGLVLAVPAQAAQDKIFLKQGAVVEGEIQGVDASGGVTIKMAQGTLPYPKANIDRIELAERPENVEGVAAVEKDDYAKGVEILKPLVDKFLGLDAEWVAEAAGYLAEALAQSGKTFESEQLCDKIIAAYPNSHYKVKGMIGKANTLLVRDKTDEAIKLLADVEKTVEAPAVLDAKTMSILSELNFMKGEAYLKKGDKALALEAYLKVTTLYYNPPNRAAEAQKRIEELRRQDSKLTVS